MNYRSDNKRQGGRHARALILRCGQDVSVVVALNLYFRHVQSLQWGMLKGSQVLVYQTFNCDSCARITERILEGSKSENNVCLKEPPNGCCVIINGRHGFNGILSIEASGCCPVVNFDIVLAYPFRLRPGSNLSTCSPYFQLQFSLKAKRLVPYAFCHRILSSCTIHKASFSGRMIIFD